MIFGFGSSPKPEEAPAPKKRVRVLVIDDSDEFRSLVKDLLEPERFDVIPIASPVKALELFSRDKDTFDLILLDFYMPHLDGAKTYEWLRKLNPNVKVIICSGADELQLRQLVAQHGMNGYIRKPFHVNEVIDLIEKVVAGPSTPPAPQGAQS